METFRGDGAQSVGKEMYAAGNDVSMNAEDDEETTRG